MEGRQRRAGESSAEAYERFEQLFEHEPELLASVEENSLPPSFRVRLTAGARPDEVIARYLDAPGVADIGWTSEPRDDGEPRS